MIPWRSLIARTIVVGAIVSVFVGGAVFVGVKLAVADPGGPITPNALTFAGVLRERIDAGATTLTFVFRKGATTVCVAPSRSFTVDSNGAFSVQVPLDVCADGGTLFDGASVVYDVRLGSATGDLLTPTEGVPITPVPYARFADQVGVNNDCPVGYARAVDAATPSGRWVCQMLLAGEGIDEVVPVGDGPSRFWVDRYEVSIWNEDPSLPTHPVYSGGASHAYPPQLPPNAQIRAGESSMIAARSIASQTPSRYITWFQAQAACAASKKRLPTNTEWTLGAMGTPDGPSDGCQIDSTASGVPRDTGLGVRCVSRWGAQDMVGNLYELVGDWAAAPAAVPTGETHNWPPDYGNDRTYGIGSSALLPDGGLLIGIPTAIIRGGNMGDREGSGVFAIGVLQAPFGTAGSVGFRCVIPR